ncbi:MAG: hypothetical protein HQK54_03760 [Oligoflexales bacterium]|nr:hypothetical protein [Oligoflexales bacterium]
MIKLFIIFMISIVPPLSAEEVERKLGQDLREECRESLAGVYLDLFSENVMIKEFIGKTLKKIKALKDSLEENEKIYGKTRSAFEKSDYNPSLSEKMVSTKSKIVILKEQIANHEAVLAGERKREEIIERNKENLKRTLEKVFVITQEHPESKKEGSYQIKVEYEYKCRQFHFLCPLPESHAAYLVESVKVVEKIRPDQPNLVSCIKYSQIRPPKKNLNITH